MPDQLRIASYNVHKAVGVDYRRSPERIARVIASLKADIVALQEVDRRLAPRPAVLSAASILRESGLVPVEVATNDVSLGWHGNALLVRDTIAVRAVERLLLPGLEPRGAVLADLETPIGPLTVVGAHLGLLRKYRRQQLMQIASDIGPERQARAVILGDFNEWRRKFGLEPLWEGYHILKTGPSFHSVAPSAALDRIALGQALQASDSGTLRTALSKLASDHLPIYADITSV